MCAAGALAGIHLSCCVVYVDHLIHITPVPGRLFDRAAFDMSVGEIHGIHIFVAGILTSLVAIIGLWKFCKCPPREEKTA